MANRDKIYKHEVQGFSQLQQTRKFYDQIVKNTLFLEKKNYGIGNTSIHIQTSFI